MFEIICNYITTHKGEDVGEGGVVGDSGSVVVVVVVRWWWWWCW
jgi:hypothetical protein